MVKPDIVGSKMARARSRLIDAEDLISVSPEEFLADTKRQDLASFYIFLAIQECIDLAAHWVADAGWGAPEDAGSIFYALADHRAIERDLAEGLRNAVGLRNRIAHGYSTVDHGQIQREFRQGAETLRRFLARVASEAGL